MQFTREQARTLQPIVSRYLRFLDKLCKRLDALSVDPTDPVYLAAHRAFDGVHALSVHLHYRTCQSGVGNPPTTAPPSVPPLKSIPTATTPTQVDTSH